MVLRRVIKSLVSVNYFTVSTFMSGQAKISSFFMTANKKRPLSESENTLNTPNKKEKTDEKVKLSPEQKKEIAKKKFAAEEKLKQRRKSLESGDRQIPDIKSVESDDRQSPDIKALIGKTWYEALEQEFTKHYFIQLTKFVESERAKHTIYPPEHQVYSWTNLCPIHEVKVVILGQDPYHGPKQAHGLCFSVQQGIKSPPSLVNMYKELANDIEGFTIPTHGTLTGWADQGVLLLNACLTVRASQANSHAGKGWEKFTDAVISWINKNTSGVVFMLWGAYAQKKGAYINMKKHKVLKSVHPSPLSAHRGFLGCKHFSKCNEYLTSQSKSPIDWKQLPPS